MSNITNNTTSPDFSRHGLSMIIGVCVSVGCVLLVFVVVLAICCIRRKKSESITQSGGKKLSVSGNSVTSSPRYIASAARPQSLSPNPIYENISMNQEQNMHVGTTSATKKTGTQCSDEFEADEAIYNNDPSLYCSSQQVEPLDEDLYVIPDIISP